MNEKRTNERMNEKRTNEKKNKKTKDRTKNEGLTLICSCHFQNTSPFNFSFNNGISHPVKNKYSAD